MNWRQFYKVRSGTDDGYNLHTNDRRSLVVYFWSGREDQQAHEGICAMTHNAA